MALHIIKLAVGADTPDDVVDWHKRQSVARAAAGVDPRPVCDTRMTPRRHYDVLDGGSLFWVIRGVVVLRQPILDIVTLDDGAGRSRCEIVLGTPHVRTAPLRRKAFQGWRYLEPAAAPPDLLGAAGGGGPELPDDLRRALIEIGAW